MRAFPDGRLELRKLLTDGPSGALSARTTTFSHAGPRGPATGRPVELRWAAAHETRSAELLSGRVYCDQMNFLGPARGLLPGAATGAGGRSPASD